ncbi:MAG: hypothetical protein OXB88_06780 [Bacteriovoracales bacterium]|nr:hypothetical protein [Bacteriovoracales bacterium]
MKFLMLSLFLSGTLSAAYIDCRSESGNTRVRLDIDDRRGELKDIRFTRKIDGERWEMVGKKDDLPYPWPGNKPLFLCDRNRRSASYPLCIEKFDLARGFVSVMFRDHRRRPRQDRNGDTTDVVFNLTSVEESRNGRFEAVLFRSLYPGSRPWENLKIDRRAITLDCRDRN